jgi:hypothetical protein
VNLIVSTPQGPELHLDVSTSQGPELQLDVSGQQEPLLLFNVSTLQGPDLLLELSIVYTTVACDAPRLDVPKKRDHLILSFSLQKTLAH